MSAAAEEALVELLADPSLTHDVMLAGVTRAFGAPDREDVLEALDDAARPLFDVVGLGLRAQAAALSRVLTDQLGLRVVTDDYRALLLGHALEQRVAHPALLAGLGHELARRAGVPSVVARGRADFWTVLQSDTCFLPIAFRTPVPAISGSGLRQACAHELASVILNALAGHAPPPDAARAQRVLEAALPALHD